MDTDSGGMAPTTVWTTDLEKAAARYRTGRMSAAEFKEILVDAFGLQVVLGAA